MKWFDTISIKNKLIVIILLVSITSISIGFLIDIINIINTFKKDMKNNITVTAKVISEYCIAPLAFYDRQGVKDIITKLSVFDEITTVILYDEADDIFAYYNKSGKEDIIEQDIPKTYSATFENIGLKVFQPIFYKHHYYGTLFIQASKSELSKKIFKHIKILLFLIIVVSILSYILAHKIQTVISKPILTLANITKKISDLEDYSLRVEKHSSDEIGMLSDGLNSMISQMQKRTLEKESILKVIEEKNKELEQIVYISSHDLRSPLVNIQGFGAELKLICEELINTLQNETIDSDIKEKIYSILEYEIPEALKYILGSAEKMGLLIGGLLQFSRIGKKPIAPENINVFSIVEQVLKNFKYQLDQKNATTTIENLPNCKGDKTQIILVFSNLIQNAIKYSDPNRILKIKIYGYEEVDKVVFCVEDNGIGIDEKHLKNIFKIFHRLNPGLAEGEGIGLTIVEKILEQHGGKIWVKSSLNEGSQFFFSLPKKNAEIL